MSDETKTASGLQAAQALWQPRATEEPADGPRLLTVVDLARWLRVSPRTVWRLEAAGKLPPCVRLGRSKRWTDSAIRRWIDSGCPSRAQIDARRAFDVAGTDGHARQRGRRQPARG